MMADFHNEGTYSSLIELIKIAVMGAASRVWCKVAEHSGLNTVKSRSLSWVNPNKVSIYILHSYCIFASGVMNG